MQAERRGRGSAACCSRRSGRASAAAPGSAPPCAGGRSSRPPRALRRARRRGLPPSFCSSAISAPRCSSRSAARSERCGALLAGRCRQHQGSLQQRRPSPRGRSPRRLHARCRRNGRRSAVPRVRCRAARCRRPAGAGSATRPTCGANLGKERVDLPVRPDRCRTSSVVPGPGRSRSSGMCLFRAWHRRCGFATSTKSPRSARAGRRRPRRRRKLAPMLEERARIREEIAVAAGGKSR